MTRLKDNYNQTIVFSNEKTICCDVKYITAVQGERFGTIRIGNQRIKVRADPSFLQIWEVVS